MRAVEDHLPTPHLAPGEEEEREEKERKGGMAIPCARATRALWNRPDDSDKVE